MKTTSSGSFLFLPGLLVLTAAAPLRAQTFPELGARALGMGGAQVADAQGASAAWWNPAALSGTRPWGAFYAHRGYGAAIYRLSLAEATPNVDRAHVELTSDPATGLPFNGSLLALRSLDMQDFTLSVATSLGDPRVTGG